MKWIQWLLRPIWYRSEPATPVKQQGEVEPAVVPKSAWTQDVYQFVGINNREV